MLERGIRIWIFCAILLFAKANNKYMKDYKKGKDSYVIYWEADNLCRWAISQKSITDNFKWEKAYISLIRIK